MKQTIIFFLLNLIVICGFSQKIGVQINYGLPYNTTTDCSEPNFEAEAQADYHIGKNFFVGGGFSYRSVGLSQTMLNFTYDRKELSIFASGFFKADLRSWLSIMPELRIGYAHIDYQLNQMNDKKQTTGGLCISEKINVAFRIIKDLHLTVGIAKHLIYTTLKASDLLRHYPAIYSDNPQIKVEQVCFDFGFMYMF